MTGDQSRTLKVGDRVCWGAKTTDLGTVIGTSWSEVTIDWDNGESRRHGASSAGAGESLMVNYSAYF
jgi:hypothetical protein